MIKNLSYAALGVGGAVALATVALMEVGNGVPTASTAASSLGGEADRQGGHVVADGVFEGDVAEFPAVFYGTASGREPIQKIRFKAPAGDGTREYRLSLDPAAVEDRRVYAELSVTNVTDGGAAAFRQFGADVGTPVNFESVGYAFQTNAEYELTLDFSKSVNEKVGYALGIGLDGRQVRFDVDIDYGYIKDFPKDFWESGANYTTNFPYGYLPTPLPNGTWESGAAFRGWYTAERGGQLVTNASMVATNGLLYAQWDFSSESRYYVDFHGNGGTGTMPRQTIAYDMVTSLDKNRFWKEGCKFRGWAETPNGGVAYKNGEAVVNLVYPNKTKDLHVVWQRMAQGGTNYFVVTETATNFWVGAAKPGAPAYFDAAGSSAFLLNVTNMPDVAGCRVALDPMDGYGRNKNVSLSVKRQTGSNSWASVASTVTEFAVQECLCSFTNGVYRFDVTGATTNDAYLVSIGAAGEQVVFDPKGGTVESGAPSPSLTFNWTVGSPYGYVPPLRDGEEYGALLGWFDSPAETNVQVTATSVVAYGESGTNTVYAHWSSFSYWVAFDKNADGAGGTMAPQRFYHDVPDALNRNQYYWPEHQFSCWTNSLSEWGDQDVVVNLCDKEGATNTLYAVWRATPGRNDYAISETGGDVFSNVTVSAGIPSYFHGEECGIHFDIVPANAMNDCRVSIDPDPDYSAYSTDRSSDVISVTVQRASVDAQGVTSWEEVCSASYLATNAVKCSFAAGKVYRFVVEGGWDNYVVGLAAPGSQITFNPCGGELEEDPPSPSLTFNWTVGTVLGYLPPLVEGSEGLGDFEGWHYTPLFGVEDPATEEDIVSNATSRTIYAHWSEGESVQLTFDWNLAETNAVEERYYAKGTTIVLYDDEKKGLERTESVPDPKYGNYGFLGWTTNAEGTLGWDVNVFSVSNGVTFYAQWTKDWKVSPMGDGLSVDGYNGAIPAEFAIPETIAPCPKPVVGIGESAFASRMGMTSLSIPSNVVFIGDGAFSNCTALATVRFPTKEVRDENATGGYLAKIVGEQDDDPVELGVGTFRDCTALSDVQLPLGVMRLPDGLFSGCTSLRSFDMPYTVMEIGCNAFARCTHLGNVFVVTEGVADIESGAFQKCARLKVVRFLGKQPGGTVATDIFKGTQRTMLVSYFENMCTTAKDYCGGDWPALPGPWPSAGSEYARTLSWIGDGLYPRRLVTFNKNLGSTPAKSEVIKALCHVGRAFGFIAPTQDDMGPDFRGWWTQPVGGRKVGNYRAVTSAMTVYAHWGAEGSEEGGEIGSRSDKDYPVHFDPDDPNFTGFYSADDDMFYYAPCTFDGIVVSEATSNLAGTVSVTFQQGSSASGETQAPFTAVVTWNDGAQTSFAGVVDAESRMWAASGNFALSAEVTKSGLYGTMTGGPGKAYKVYGARNRYAMSNEASQFVVMTSLYATRGTWHVVLESAEDAPAVANGYTALAVTISGMGQATVTGTLADGTKVFATSRLIIGDGCCCLPVNLRPYWGTGGFSFMLWFAWYADGSFGDDEAKVTGLTEWTTPWFSTKIGPAKICDAAGNVKDFPLTFIDDKRYSGGAEFSCEQQTLAKLRMDDTTWTVVGGDLQISYQPDTGLFSGNVLVDTGSGKATAVVNGAFTDRISSEGEVYHGFGTAVVDGVGSAKVEITTVD